MKSFLMKILIQFIMIQLALSACSNNQIPDNTIPSVSEESGKTIPNLDFEDTEISVALPEQQETIFAIDDEEFSTKSTEQALSYITTDNVNLRETPTTDSTKITTVPNGTVVMVIDFLDREWFLVDYEGQSGYMKAEYLTRTAFRTAIPLIYTYVHDFSEGLAAVLVGDWRTGKWGFIDKAGIEVTSFIYDEAYDFKENLARVKIDDGQIGKWGFVDQRGYERVPLAYEYAMDYSGGMAAVLLDKKWGFIDRNGRQIIPCRYSSVQAFSENLAAVQSDGKWGFIDMIGSEIVPCKYDGAFSFSEGMAAVRIGDEGTGKWGFIDYTGREIVPHNYDYVSQFHEGMAAVAQGDVNTAKWGFVDQSGDIVVPFIYDYAGGFTEGMAMVRLGDWQTGKMGFIDKSGNEVIPLNYGYVNNFSEGMAAVTYGNWADTKSTWGFIDKTGREVIPLIYDKVSDFNGGFAAFGSGDLDTTGKGGFINKNGRIIVPQMYSIRYNVHDHVIDSKYSEEMMAVCIDGKWGFITMPKNEIENISLDIIRDNWAWAILDENGTKLTAASYSSSAAWDDLTLAVSPYGLTHVQFIGEKDATEEHSMGLGYYFPFYEDITGPVWATIDNLKIESSFSTLLLPDSCQKGMLSFTSSQVKDTYESGFDNHGHPYATLEDIKRVSALHEDREVMNSELLATDLYGGRVSLFQFTNKDKGLFILAYVREERMIIKEFTANLSSYSGGAYWRADLEDDNIGFFEVNLLCETDKGLVIGYTWNAPEGSGKYLFVEQDGEFAKFIDSGWYYNWEGGFSYW